MIHAVKGGHRGIVEALLKKYADVDIPGKDRKTAIYVAVEKQNVGIVKLLLNCNPDLEIATKVSIFFLYVIKPYKSYGVYFIFTTSRRMETPLS